MTELSVQYRQDPQTSWWTATMPEEPAVVTQGKTLKEAYENVRKALSLVREDANRVQLRGETDWSDRADLSEDVLRAVQDESDLRVRVLEMQDQLERVTQTAVRVLIKNRRFSYGDAGQLLGITRQRVEQIDKRMSEAESSENRQAHEF
jgi:predicted RNase H-like HicB family nuclease